MSKTKHTPGEWEENKNAICLTEDDGDAIECIQIYSGETEIGFISFDQVTLEEGNANCNLFKAAPKLLNALEDAYLQIQMLSNRSLIVAANTDSNRCIYRDLISNATGKTSQEVQEGIEFEAIKQATS